LEKKRKIVQISSAHSNFDNRIFNKISTSLASHGYDVDLIIQHDKDEEVNGINIKALPIIQKKTDRVFKILPIIFVKCIKYPPQTIFHIHDPELVAIGLLLNVFGYKVIYDIHEDNATGVPEKEYLPKLLRGFLYTILISMERLAHKHLYTIIAEEYYEERFPKAVKILNLPKIEWAKTINVERKNPSKVLYTGSITFDRGAINHINVLSELDHSIGIKMIGICSPHVHDELMQKVGENSNRLEIEGVSEHVPFSRIVNDYQKDDWIAGLAIFPKSKFYERKHLTKFYEYMAAGLPIIYTDNSAWKKLLEPLNVGISVNPDNPKEIADAIEKLKDSPLLRSEMAMNGREAVRKYYNWEVEELKLLEFYESL
jgi:glycosyltransferase involved in cell wall biosynthesis